MGTHGNYGRNNGQIKVAYLNWVRKYVVSLSDEKIVEDLKILENLPKGYYDWEIIACPHFSPEEFEYISKFYVDYLGHELRFAIRKRTFYDGEYVWENSEEGSVI